MTHPSTSPSYIPTSGPPVNDPKPNEIPLRYPYVKDFLEVVSVRARRGTSKVAVKAESKTWLDEDSPTLSAHFVMAKEDCPAVGKYVEVFIVPTDAIPPSLE